MSDNFSYLIDKIQRAEIKREPFAHVYINDFFNDRDFQNLINSPEIKVGQSADDYELFETLFAAGYKVINFPGCVTDKEAYIKWHRKKSGEVMNTSSCEGFGMTLRLFDSRTPFVKKVADFFASDEFNKALAEKFNIDFNECISDGGIQKYLDGYEISPHPDIRKKAATFMVNINPNTEAEKADHHTHYMKFKANRQYVQAYWEGNEQVDRCWVPWDWCETIQEQRENNSIVLFAPSDDTLHAVKASYDHLKSQRTQLYGNLWYSEDHNLKTNQWEQLDLTALEYSAGNQSKLEQIRSLVSRNVPTTAKLMLKRVVKSGGKNSNSIGQRNI